MISMIVAFFAAIVAGAVNAVAGGGTFFAFPALLAVGIPPVIANATCSVATWPAAAASAYGFRAHLQGNRRLLPYVLVVACVGSAIGAWLLTITPDTTFELLIPWLLLLATLLFASRRHMADTLEQFPTFPRLLMLMVMIGGIAIYGGFFGAGIGIMMLAALQWLGMRHMHRMNAFKAVIGTVINGVAVIIFIYSDLVAWREGIVMVFGGLIGGYYGAKLSLKIPTIYVRRFVISIGLILSIFYFFRYYIAV